MKTVLRYAAAGAALATFGFASQASAADADASVAATILSTLTISEVTTDNLLQFGSITDSTGLSAPSTVTIAPNGTRSCGAGLSCSGPSATPSFSIQGLAGAQVIVSFPTSVDLTHAGGAPASMADEMTVTGFTTDLAANPFTLAAGSNLFNLGGTLNVNPLQAPGVYTGAVTVEVQYN